MSLSVWLKWSDEERDKGKERARVKIYSVQGARPWKWPTQSLVGEGGWKRCF